MIKACLLVVAGGLAAQHSRVLIGSDLCKLTLVASLVLLLRPGTRSVACLLLGFTLFVQAGTSVIDARLDARFAGDSLLTQVRVIDFPRVNGDSVVMFVTPIDDQRLPQLSRVSWFEPPEMPAMGDTWEFELRLRPPRGSSNPGLFDFEALLFRQQIHASGYVVNGKRNRLLATNGGTLFDGLRRQYVRRALDASASQQVAAVLSAVGVGTRHLISTEQWRRYALSGTSHLMAISGLHVGLAATSVFLLLVAILGVARVGSGPYLLAVIGGVTTSGAYAALSGFGVPAQRAELMLVLLVAAVFRRRQPDPAAALAGAALIVYFLDPVASMTPGFSLSFSAVALLLWLARRNNTTAAASLTLKGTRALRQLVIMQVFLLFGLMPLTVLIFQRVAFLAMPANLLAVPVFSVVTVPFTLAGVALGHVVEAWGNAMLRIAALSIAFLETIIEAIVRVPFADVTVANISGHMWLVVFAPALWVLLPKGWPGRWLAMLAVATLILHTPKAPPRACFDAHVLDVGQGLATVVQTERHLLVFDTGMLYRGGGSVARQVLVPFLRSRGLHRIDWLVVSHADIDHSGGVVHLFEYADIMETLAGEQLQTVPTALQCQAGQDWTADGVSFRILHPDPATPRAGNNSSCVLLVTAGAHSLLLTGDIEADAERELAQGANLGPVDVVVVPHHGSLTSSSVPFVGRTSPRIAIVSAGYDNRWGFPKRTVVERWQSVGTEVLNTATAGAVSMRVCAQGGIVAMRKDRHERRRFWRDAEG